MAIVRNFKLFLNAGSQIPLVIHANQYDSGEQWRFTLYNQDGSVYEPSSGAIVGIKSDGHGIINTGTVSGGKVVITETQQMTAAVGKNVFELLIDDQTHGTANFMVLVELRPGDNADLSESDYSLFEEAINGTSQAAIKAGVQEWMDENLTDPTDPIVDASLSLSGAAADAKKTGDEISDLKSALEDIEEQIEGGGTGSGLTTEIKQALLQIAQKVAYIDDDGQTYYDDLYDALYPPVVYTAITLNTNSLSFGALNTTQTLIATTTPSGGAVTWSSSNTSVATVSQTGVVTSVGYGNATITATCGGLTATCSVAITQATLTRLIAVFNQVGVTVYDTDSLDSLKSHLTVRATYSDDSTVTLADSDYTLSGELTVGTSTITVSYGGMTVTFNVNVTHKDAIYKWDLTQSLTDVYEGVVATINSDMSIGTDGVKLINTGSFIELPAGTMANGRRLEVDFVAGGTWTSTNGSQLAHGEVVKLGGTAELYWRANNGKKYFMYTTDWQDVISASVASTKNFLDGKTMFVNVDANGTITVGYVDNSADVVVGTSPATFTGDGTVLLGKKTSQAMYGITVSAIRVI